MVVSGRAETDALGRRREREDRIVWWLAREVWKGPS
jgi:hypothetical protein